MTPFTFPSGVFLTLLSRGGYTFASYSQVGAGLVCLSWPDGQPQNALTIFVDPQVSSAGFAQLGMAHGDVVVLYRRDGNPTVVTGVTLSPLSPGNWEVPCEGNSPIAWGPDGMFGAQLWARVGYVHRGTWPGGPTMPVTQGYPDGIAYMRPDGQPAFVKDVAGSVPGMIDPRDAGGGLMIGKHPNGGVAAKKDGRTGWLVPGELSFGPAGCQQENGRWTIGWHSENSRGAGPVTILSDLTEDEVLAVGELPEPSMPPVDSVPLLNRRFNYAAFCFLNKPSTGNIGIPIRPSMTASRQPMVLLPAGDYIARKADGSPAYPWLHTLSDGDVYAVYVNGAPSYPLERAVRDARPVAERFGRVLVIYQDSFPLEQETLDLAKPGEIVSCVFLRGLNESVETFVRRCQEEYGRATALCARRGVVFAADLNLKGDPDRPPDGRWQAETWCAVTGLARDAGWTWLLDFAVGRSDIDDEALAPYRARFKDGITARLPVPLPPVVTVPPKPPKPAVQTLIEAELLGG